MDQRFIAFPVFFGQLIAIPQELKARGFSADHRAQRRRCGCKGQAVHALQADKDHRELPMIFRAQLFVFCDFQAVKQTLVRPNLEE